MKRNYTPPALHIVLYALYKICMCISVCVQVAFMGAFGQRVDMTVVSMLCGTW